MNFWKGIIPTLEYQNSCHDTEPCSNTARGSVVTQLDCKTGNIGHLSKEKCVIWIPTKLVSRQSTERAIKIMKVSERQEKM